MGYPTVSTTNIVSGVTVVDCQREVRSWRLFRSLLEFLIPTCNCTFIQDTETKQDKYSFNHNNYNYYSPRAITSSNSTTITGTIFGYRKGKVSFCIQTNSNSTTDPILLLELSIPTKILAREMRGGFLRIALECSDTEVSNYDPNTNCLLSMPFWTMFVNGRKVGYAAKRRPSKSDLEALRLMGSVVSGAGVINGKELDRDHDQDELMYLRANFERICGSVNSQSFHLVDPDGCIGQEFSIFFYRSCR